MKKLLLGAMALLLTSSSFAQTTEVTNNAFIPIKDNLYQFQHGVWLATFIVTNDGIILVDPLNAKAATWFKAEAKKRFNKEVRYLVNTHAHYDHAEGGEVFTNAIVVAQENIVEEYQAENVKARYPDVTFSDHMTLHLGGDTLELFHFGNDHGKSMLYAYHPRTKAVTTVDVAAKERLPYKDLPYDDPQATIDTLKKLEAMDIDYILPGHGNVGNKNDLVKVRRYWELLRASVAAHMANGKSLAEIKQLVPAQMSEYSQWQQYKEWQPYNIEAMHRILSKQGL
ncbi:MAG: MBL fold metallo-hydrolase [Steroidobacteraceae bacterium]